MMAFATRYEVKTQVTSSIVAERLPAMCGSDTFTTVVSSTSMKVQNITEMAMIQGLTCFCSDMRSGKRRGYIQDNGFANRSVSRRTLRHRGEYPREFVGLGPAYCTCVFRDLE